MKVQLINTDQVTIDAEVEVPDFPDNPQVVIYNKRAYVEGTSYNGPTQYIEQYTFWAQAKGPVTLLRD